jgi:hypothetical protein
MGEFSFHTKLLLYIQLAIAISIEWTISTIGIFAIFIPTMHLLPVEMVYAKLNTRNVITGSNINTYRPPRLRKTTMTKNDQSPKTTLLHPVI